jgi:hypothetical protein
MSSRRKSHVIEAAPEARISRRTVLSWVLGFGTGTVVGAVNGSELAELGSGSGPIGEVLKGKVTPAQKEGYIEFTNGMGTISALAVAFITAQAPYPKREKNITFCSFLAGVGLGNWLGYRSSRRDPNNPNLTK